VTVISVTDIVPLEFLRGNELHHTDDTDDPDNAGKHSQHCLVCLANVVT
jgi:hypothetical protein